MARSILAGVQYAATSLAAAVVVATSCAMTDRPRDEAADDGVANAVIASAHAARTDPRFHSDRFMTGLISIVVAVGVKIVLPARKGTLKVTHPGSMH